MEHATNSVGLQSGQVLLTAQQSSSHKTVLSFQVIKMLVAVIVLFTICWAPSLIDNVLVAFEFVGKLNYGYLKHMRQAFALMSYFNSCVNPVVYAFMSKNFRATFKYAICSCIKGKNYARQCRYNKQAVSATFTTNTATFSAAASSDEPKAQALRSPTSSYHMIASHTQETIDVKL